MTKAQLNALPRDTWLLIGAFILIIAGFSLSNSVSLYEIHQDQLANRIIAEKTTASIELLSRIERDLDRKRLLVDTHIVEKQSHRGAGIEAEIARVDADFSTAADAYSRTVNGTGHERAAWRKLQMELDAIQPGLAKTIELSRNKRDLAAAESMHTTENRFQYVDQALDDLIDLNHKEANHQINKLIALQQKSRIVLGALTFASVAFALFTATWVSRLLTRRRNDMQRSAMLLEERNRDLDAFAGRVAHDLRGPLTTIGLAVSALSPSAQDEGTSAILQRAVKHMETLIKDLLTLSSIGAQLPSAVCETAHAAALAAEELESQVKSASGVMHVDVEPATVRCSPGLLRQVLWNLGENAVKYRRSGVPIEIDIRGRATRQSYEFTVADNGSGMSPDEIHHVFEPFFRGESARSQRGTGLGLSIVKRVIEANGGAVSVHSEPGHGTTFDISLPLARAA